MRLVAVGRNWVRHIGGCRLNILGGAWAPGGLGGLEYPPRRGWGGGSGGRNELQIKPILIFLGLLTFQNNKDSFVVRHHALEETKASIVR